MEMSVTRAMTELRLLDRRIRYVIRISCFAGAVQRKNFLPGHGNNEESCENVGLHRQLLINLLRHRMARLHVSFIKDMINRRQMIKSAILRYNRETEVVVSGKNMTIAEAAELKSSLEYEKLLLAEMKRQYAETKREVDHRNDTVCETGDALLKSRLEKSRSQIVGSDDIRKILESYSEQNEWKFVSPENMEALMTELEDKLDFLEFELDYVLSEVNAARIFVGD